VSGNGVALTAINASNVTSGTLDNARTTGNTANSASTLVLRDTNGSFGANIVTATFSGNGATLSAINASNISSGTIDNSRTTAASANGASTIVLRDSSGSFAGNVITATTSNATTFNGTTGAFTNVSGNGVALTAINASNISSGTIANARTTAASANGASTIVTRDANGDFSARTITAALSGAATSVSNALTAGTGLNATATYNGSAAITFNAVGSTINSQVSGYTLVAADAGKTISITTGGVTIPNAVMAAGNIVTIYNNSASSQTITQGASLTLQWAGQSSSTTGNRTLGLYGIATILFISASNAVISGAGLT
jgi:hypothetical protein